MARSVCGWCGKPTYMDAVMPNPIVTTPSFEYGMGYIADAAFRCANCERLSVVTWRTSSNPGIFNTNDGPAEYEDQRWSPRPIERHTFEDVPSRIGGAAAEAYSCHSIGAYRGAGALARAVIEATAKESGITSGTLDVKIDALHDAGFIREVIRDTAHEIRHFGNAMAHGDFADPVTEEESDEILALMSEVLNDVFQTPARTERLKQSRLASRTAKK